MTKRLSKKERQDIIDRWLNDEEDPDYNVIAKKEEGKFIVRRKKQITPEPEESESKSEEPISPKTTEYQKSLKEKRKKPVKDETNVQILEYLKVLGDDIEQRKRKKEMKKEVKYQLAKNTVVETPDTIPPEEFIEEVPMYRRRRISIAELTRH
jgi:hypothetical protein